MDEMMDNQQQQPPPPRNDENDDGDLLIDDTPQFVDLNDAVEVNVDNETLTKHQPSRWLCAYGVRLSTLFGSV